MSEMIYPAASSGLTETSRQNGSYLEGSFGVCAGGAVNVERPDAYLEEGGMRCPVCGSEEIEGGFVRTGGGEGSQGMRCLECDARWTDIYRLDHVLMN
jgi:hypothetical protein